MPKPTRPKGTSQAPSANADPADLMPTLPRRNFDQAPPPKAQRQQAPPREQTGNARKESSIRPWMVIAVVLVIALVVAFVVAFSGPDVAAGK